MRKRNLYGARSQEVRECFERAGGPEKVLVVPMDLAKNEHMAVLCLGNGECLCKPFAVRNSPEGADCLVGRIDGLRRQRAIGRENVLIGGEDPAPYTLNFIHRIRQDGFPFLRVNATEASLLRNNRRAVSDVLALDGIGQALIQQRGRMLESFGAWGQTCLHTHSCLPGLGSAGLGVRPVFTRTVAWRSAANERTKTGLTPIDLHTHSCLAVSSKQAYKDRFDSD